MAKAKATLEFDKKIDGEIVELQVKTNAEQVTFDSRPLSDYLKEKHEELDRADVQLKNTIEAHTAKTDNPHNVTKLQVGLGNADNTSDRNKPVSDAVQTELNKKFDTPGTALEQSGTTLNHSKYGTPGTYKSVTVDAQGHVTAGTNPTTISGYGINDAYTIDEVDNKFSALEMSIDWKESVNTLADLTESYPNPEDGWTVNVKDTDYTYRWTGDEWIVISANAIPVATAELDGKMSAEHVTELQDLSNKKHSHENKSVLDTITQVMVNAWNNISSHIADAVSHITGSERTNWNDAYNKRHDHSNRDVLDGITTDMIEEWTAGGTGSHSHTNKAVLDQITSGKVTNWDTAFTNNHAHNNKSVLDAVTQTQVDTWNAKLEGAGSGLSKSGTTINHSNSITAGNVGPGAAATLAFGGTFTVPQVTYDAQGHLTSAAAYTMTMPAAPTTITGNAGTATKWAAARTLSLTGDGTASLSVDGSTNVNGALTLANSGVMAGSYGPAAEVSPGAGGKFQVPQVTVDAKGRTTAVVNRTVTLPSAYSHPTFTASTVGESANKTLTFGGTFVVSQVGRDANGHASNINARTMTMPAAPTTVSGNAGTATKLQTARTITYTGDMIGSGSFDGSANLTVALTRTPLSAVMVNIGAGIIAAAANEAVTLTSVTKVGTKLAAGDKTITVSGAKYLEVSGAFLFTDTNPGTTKTITIRLMNGSTVVHSVTIPANSVLPPVLFDASTVTNVNVITNAAWSGVSAEYTNYLTVKEI